MAAPGVPGNISLLATPQLFGHLFNYGLFGMLVVQVYVYHISFPSDPKYLKAFIYGLFVVECVQVGISTHDAYEVFGVGWGDLAALNNPQLLWLTPVLSGFISAAVQCFFAWRIYMLSKQAYLGVFISLVALMEGAGAMATGIMAHVLALTDSSIQVKTRASGTVWLAGSASCDIIIAFCMLYFLSRGKRGMATDAILSRLIRLTIETGTLTASVAVVDLVLFLVFKDNNLHFTPALVLSKLYSNSLMVLFNNRTQMRNLKGGVQSMSGRVWISTTSRSDVEAGDVRGVNATVAAIPQQFALQKLGPDTNEDGYDMRKVSAH